MYSAINALDGNTMLFGVGLSFTITSLALIGFFLKNSQRSVLIKLSTSFGMIGIGISLLALYNYLPYWVTQVSSALILIGTLSILTNVHRFLYLKEHQVCKYLGLPFVLVIMLLSNFSNINEVLLVLGFGALISSGVSYIIHKSNTHQLKSQEIISVFWAINASFLLFMLWYIPNYQSSSGEYVFLLDQPFIKMAMIINLFTNTFGVVSCAMLVITHNERLLEAQAHTDKLTGVPNRRYFDTRCSDEFNKYLKKRLCLSVAIIDIDNFKVINDTYGHCVGDEVLKHVADIARSCVRDSDALCRYGGEEFAIVMTGCSDKYINVICDRVMREIHKTPYVSDKHDIPITVSIGVTRASLTDNDVSDIICRADTALYQAKHQGKNRVIHA